MVDLLAMQQPTVRRGQHVTGFLEWMAVIALGFAAMRTTDAWTFGVCLGVALVLVLWRIYLIEETVLLRVGLAVLAVALFGFVFIRTVYFPAPLTVNTETQAALAKTTGEQGVRNLLANQGRPYHSLVSLFNGSVSNPPGNISNPTPAIDPAVEKERLESNLTLWEFYPKYEWPLSGETTTNSVPIDGKTLRAVYSPNRDDYRLTPLLANGNAKYGVPLENPRVVIWLPSSVEIKPTRLWAPNVDANTKSFFSWADFGPVLTAPSSVNESLFLKFPGPGRYPVKYRLEGVAKGIAVTKDGMFTLELVEPSAVTP